MQRARTSTTTRLLIACVLALGLAGCGSGDGGDDTAAADQTTTDGMDMSDGHDEDGAGDHAEFTFGEPAEAADADRTVEVAANDDLSYDPSSIEVTAGETITFVVTNTGQAVHEFTLGDAAFQDEHEEEMAAMLAEGEMMMHDEPNTMSLDPGETGELTWHFTETGEVLYGCHQPGHYAGGMVGGIDVQS